MNFDECQIGMHGFIAQIRRILSQDLLTYLNPSFFIDLLEKCEMSISIFFVANSLWSWKYHSSILPLLYIDLVLRYVPYSTYFKIWPRFHLCNHLEIPGLERDSARFDWLANMMAFWVGHDAREWKVVTFSFCAAACAMGCRNEILS